MEEIILDLVVKKGEEYSLKTIINLFGDVQCLVTGNGKLEVILYSPTDEDNIRIFNLFNIMPGVRKVTEKYSSKIGGKNGKKFRNTPVKREKVFSA